MKILLLLLIIIPAISFSQRGGELMSAKVLNVEKANEHVHKLPYSEDYIKTVVLSEIDSKKEIVSPNYPSNYKSVKELEKWISDFPEEHISYVKMVKEVTLFYAQEAKNN
jgi:hypothetical protein